MDVPSSPGPGAATRRNTAARRNTVPAVVAVLVIVIASILVWQLLSGEALTSEDSWGAISKESKLVTASQEITKTITYQDDSRLPDWLAGQRAEVQVDGKVEAFVDLGAIEPGDVTIKDGTVTVILPPIQYSDPSIANIDWKVDDRGLFDRVNDFFSSDDVFRNQVIGELNDELAAEAKGSPKLESEAKRNARTALEAILVPAGADRVVVKFRDDASSPG